MKCNEWWSCSRLSRDQKSINGTNNNLTEKNHGVSKFLRSFLQHVLHVINFDERGEAGSYLRTIIHIRKILRIHGQMDKKGEKATKLNRCYNTTVAMAKE